MQPSIRLFWGEPLMNCWYLRLSSFSSKCRLHCKMSYLKTKHQPLIGHKTRVGSAFAQYRPTGCFWPITVDGACVCATTYLIGQQDGMVNFELRTTNWLTSIIHFFIFMQFVFISLYIPLRNYTLVPQWAIIIKSLSPQNTSRKLEYFHI